MIPVVVIVGPTGSGKSDTSVELALRVGGEIVSADSMQIYRGMDIATAKPTMAERLGVPHYLFDVANPDDDFTVTDYVELADAAIADIHRRGKVPIIVGGTGFYIHSLIDRYTFPPRSDNYDFRDEMKVVVDTEGNEALHDRLRAVDPESAARLHSNDTFRVIRALEVYHLTGNPLSSYNQKDNANQIYIPQFFGLKMDKDLLYNRLEKRVYSMLAAGLFMEARRMHAAGYSHDLTSMKGIAYRQFCSYFRGEYSFQTAVELIIRDTRRYAKRQFTWFNPDERINWIDIINCGGTENAAIEIYTKMMNLA
ncbi:MAG: tRNA (adenosine(37)-N6)-dimethylallyltransferase MiaA [bacterium]